jgi:hypothetical protein
MTCKWLKACEVSAVGYICLYWARCPELLDRTSTCPCIQYARAFEVACENPDTIEREKQMLERTI